MDDGPRREVFTTSFEAKFEKFNLVLNPGVDDYPFGRVGKSIRDMCRFIGQHECKVLKEKDREMAQRDWLKETKAL
jgi:hypothetical protein